MGKHRQSAAGADMLLTEARQEFTQRIVDCMVPIINAQLRSMFVQAKAGNAPGQHLIGFQTLLRDVPNWTPFAVNAEINKMLAFTINKYSPIKNERDFVGILQAVFRAHLLILASVGSTHARNRSVNMNMPSLPLFVHTTYNNTANALFDNPYLMQDDNRAQLNAEINKCIERTVREFVPMTDVIERYVTMHDSVDPSSESDMSSISDDDVDSVEDLDTSTPMPPQPPSPAPVPVPVASPPSSPHVYYPPTAVDNIIEGKTQTLFDDAASEEEGSDMGDDAFDEDEFAVRSTPPEHNPAQI